MNEIWYYEYIIKIWNAADSEEEICSGVVPAENIIEAVNDINNYYGDELIEIKTLKPIVEGPVFDFKEANDEDNFDFIINKKS